MTRAQEHMTNQPLMIALPILGSAAAITTMTVAPVTTDFSGMLENPETVDAPFSSSAPPGPVASLPAPPAPDATLPDSAEGLIVVNGKRPIPSAFVVKIEAEGTGGGAETSLPSATAPEPAGQNPPAMPLPALPTESKSPDRNGSDTPDDPSAPTTPAGETASPAATVSMILPTVPHPRKEVAQPQPPSADRQENKLVDAPAGKALPQAVTHEASMQRIVVSEHRLTQPIRQEVLPDVGAGDKPDPAIPSLMPTPSAPERPPDAPRAVQASLSVHSPRFAEELGIAIARHVAWGDDAARETMTVRLDPPEHGRIEVSLTFEDGGPLRAVVAASHSATLDLLRRDSADLARALSQAGVSTDAQSFSFSAQTQDGQRGRHGAALASQPDFGAADEDGTDFALQDCRKLHARGSLNLIA